MKKIGLFIACLFLITCIGCMKSDESKVEDLVTNYYQGLKEGNYEASLQLLGEEYLDFIGMTKREVIDEFEFAEKQGNSVSEIAVVSVKALDKASLSEEIPLPLQERITDSEHYLVKVNATREGGAEFLDFVLLALIDGEWQIRGIASTIIN
ncbi:hypothetical protein [Virgibacillus salexigens]|uniref:Lumazine-binding protein n=1 Tax=Virgibacillus massiliensis TaxID=1462526 RepID=A0A024QFI5_9BACI|nr:hypothetical protein [Virgibacillus massiliensis]CDQ41269.1 hypothetical protein BN990_03630 [Virgibacillus massiliensis]